MSQYRVGIDIGGTVTDLCVLDEQGGEVFNSKVLSTPADLTQGVMNTLDEFFGDGQLPEDVAFLFHATTIATNALLERKGAKTWLLIAAGFTDVYETPGSQPDLFRGAALVVFTKVSLINRPTRRTRKSPSAAFVRIDTFSRSPI